MYENVLFLQNLSFPFVNKGINNDRSRNKWLFELLKSIFFYDSEIVYQ